MATLKETASFSSHSAPLSTSPEVKNLLTTQRQYWLAQLLGWGSLGALTIYASGGDSREAFLRFAAAKLFCMITGLFLTHAWRGFLKRHSWLDRNRAYPIKGIFAGLLLLSLLQMLCLLFADFMFRDNALLKDKDITIAPLLGLYFLWFLVFLVWTLLYAFVQSQRRAIRFELEKLQLEVNIKDAELRALQAQVNPHFFFNSLNSIRALVFQDSDAAARAIGQLSGMMRYSLQANHLELVKLADELNAVDAYLAMEKLRFEERMQLEIAIPESLKNTILPPMMLQTLVENAVKHGVEQSTTCCVIKIAAVQHADTIEISVANQGKLQKESTSTHLGLANVGKRLQLLFGPQASCDVIELNGWVIATLRLPRGTV